MKNFYTGFYESFFFKKKKLFFFIATPFDVVKTRLQSQSIFKGSSLLNSKLYPTSLTTCCSEFFFSAHNLRREFLCRLDSSHISSNQASTLSCTIADAATLAPNRQI